MFASPSERSVGIVAASGRLRVTITAHPTWSGVIVRVSSAALSCIVLSAIISRGRWSLAFVFAPVLFVLICVTAAIAWLYELKVCEVIEFDAHRLLIRKELFGWCRTSQYAMNLCKGLEARDPTHEDNYGLQCKVGWKLIRFGAYVLPDTAEQIIEALHLHFPEIAKQMCGQPETLTVLHLN